METATTVLVMGGMSVLAFGVLLGIPMVAARRAAARAPRYLFSAHLAAIIQGAVLLALTVPLELASLSAGVATGVAAALVAGMALFVLGLTTNWLQGVEDGFAENAIGSTVSAVGTPLVVVGIGILLHGVATGL